MDTAVHFSSRALDWATPWILFRGLDAEFHFELDVCATAQNAKCRRFFSPEEDGLSQVWTGVCWMNPPYGRQVGLWVRKAAQSAQDGATVVALLPARTDTAWWHDWVAPYAELRFLRGRVKFEGATANAPFPSVIAVYRPAPKN